MKLVELWSAIRLTVIPVYIGLSRGSRIEDDSENKALKRLSVKMTFSKSIASVCRYCRFYTPEGRRGGQCNQLGVEVKGQWAACPLASPPFAPSWERLEHLITCDVEEPLHPEPVSAHSDAWGELPRKAESESDVTKIESIAQRRGFTNQTSELSDYQQQTTSTSDSVRLAG